jgi:ABC-2 type transport system permease protein
MTFIHDTLIVFRRQMRLSLRNPAWVIIALVQPILYLALFGPLLTKVPLNGSTSAAGTAGAYKFFVPGLLIQLGLFGSTFVGFAIISDWRAGVIERFRVTPVSRLAIMTGRVLRDVVTLVVQAVILVLVAVAFGLRAPVTAILLSLGFIVVVAVGLASVSYATALLVKSEDAFAPMLNSVVLPLVLLSGIMLPLTLGPGWLQGIGRISPFRYIIDAMRGAFYGQYATTIMLEGVLVAVGLAAVCLWLGSRVFVRENAWARTTTRRTSAGTTAAVSAGQDQLAAAAGPGPCPEPPARARSRPARASSRVATAWAIGSEARCLASSGSREFSATGAPNPPASRRRRGRDGPRAIFRLARADTYSAQQCRILSSAPAR